ncbi:hypothetical protein HNQ07_001659 [Deinococcus metalli]|uniref:Right-handed parallel beta-helix repeat-containing protein n=1 Tax=Deinococcus metalli TaxID=1141878 RepID=A0A7W8KDJ4_9DEIO|nr:hypothetical protein [Deinococcus metalli]MBB5376202.1 hypothetical protein [Deinococcus metalli]GHF40023.1 hypothetical protein GCM10017781_15800 [Deinococcus metalli]
MNAHVIRRHTAAPLTLLSLALSLAACGGGTATPPGTPVTTLSDSGAGSLREAIGAVAAGDTLRLTQGGTLTLQSPLVIDKNVTVIASGVTIDAAGKGRALEVASGATVTLKGGTLKGGTGGVLIARLTTASVGERSGPARVEPRARLRASGLSAQAATPTVGGVLLNRGTLTLDGVTITGGKANIGGGIFNASGATLTLTGSTSVTGNTADLIDPNDDTIDQGVGGGIFNKGTLFVSGGSVSNNNASYSGGGIQGGIGSAITISGGKVDGNTTTYPVTVEGTVTTGAAGGGVFTSGDLTVTGGSVSGNSTSFFGGGITVQSTCADAECTTVNRPVFKLSGGTIENNAQTDTTGIGGGGGLWSDGTTTITGGTVRANTADGGAGMVAWYTTDITGGVFEGNQARGSGGGLFFLNSGRTYHIGGTARITGNKAVNSGGGFSIARSAEVTMDGGSVSGNAVTGTTDGGGGVRVGGGTAFTLVGGEIKGNTAVKTGGGITVGGKVTMTGGSITGNTVTNRTDAQGGGGGGVRLYAGASMTASGGTISNNVAWFGGGVETNGAYQTSPTSTFVLSGATVSNNRAEDNNVGGGFWNDGSLSIQSGSVTGNVARQGAGVFNTKVAVYSQAGGSVSGNTPDNVYTAP